MFLAFLAVYLITYFSYEKFYKDKIHTNIEPWHSVNNGYRDMKENLLTDLSYCGRKSCLLKCCGDRQYLDSSAFCKDEQYYRDILNIGVDNWKKITKEIKDNMKYLNNNFVLIQKAEDSFEPLKHFSSVNFYLSSKNGSLFYTKEPSPERWIELNKLKFCIDYRFNSPNAKMKFEFVFELVKEFQESVDRKVKFDKSNIIIVNCSVLAAGMAITVLSITWSLYHLPKQIERRYITCTLLAYLSSLTFAYGLKILHLVGINTGALTTRESKYIGAAVYFLLLSAICWPLALTYNLLASTRKFRVKQNTDDEVVDIKMFFRFSKFAWGLPLLLTMLAVALDKSYLSTWLIEKPPFDNCFDNACYLIYSYDMWSIRCALRDNPHLANNKFNGLRSLVCRKFIEILLLTVLLQFLPDFPALLCVVLYISCATTWNVLVIVSFYQKNVFLNFYNRTLQVQAQKIATITNNNLEKGNNKAIISYNHIENDLAMLFMWIWQKIKNIHKRTKADVKYEENCENADNINSADVERY